MICEESNGVAEANISISMHFRKAYDIPVTRCCLALLPFLGISNFMSPFAVGFSVYFVLGIALGLVSGPLDLRVDVFSAMVSQ